MTISNDIKQREPIVDMSANENPFGPSAKAIQAISDRLPSLASYPDRDDGSVCQALVECHGSQLTRDHFTTTNSGVDMLSLIERALFEQTNSVIVCPPAFEMYRKTSGQNHATVLEAPLHVDDFAVNVDAVVAAVRADTRLVFICNPDNPTGRCFDNVILTQLLDRLPDHVTLVYDEVYYHFIDAGQRPQVVEHVLAGKNIIALHSFSKAYGLAGMRLGYVMAKPELIKKIKAVKLPFQVGALGLVAMRAALLDSEHVEKTVKNNAEQRTFLLDALATIGYRVWPTQANFILIECHDEMTSDSLVTALRDKGIKVRPAFGLDRHIRVTVSLQEHNARFVQIMAELMANSLAQQARS